MARTNARGSDPGRLIDLMWSPATRVGRSGTTVGAIVDAGIDLADADGLDALTMRAVAERVGIGAMTLYGYLPGRSELVELMVDRAAAQTYLDRPEPHEVGRWDAALRHVAECNWTHLLAHRWLAEAPQGRPILGPGVCRKYEAELRPLEGIGLDDHEMDLALSAVLTQVTQAARWQNGLDRVRAESGMADDRWWQLYGPVLGVAMAGEHLPISGRVGRSTASAGEPRRTWEFMLDALLVSLERRITAQPATHEPRESSCR